MWSILLSVGVSAGVGLAFGIYATPAIAGGRIFVRTRGALYCFGS